MHWIVFRFLVKWTVFQVYFTKLQISEFSHEEWEPGMLFSGTERQESVAQFSSVARIDDRRQDGQFMIG